METPTLGTVIPDSDVQRPSRATELFVALLWAKDEADALCSLIEHDMLTFTPENVVDCLRHIIYGIEARQ